MPLQGHGGDGEPVNHIDPEAEAEFNSGYDYYQGKGVGLGYRFSAAVGTVLARIEAQPQLHQVVFKYVRRAVVKGCPYCIYYREEATRIRVLSIFPTSRDPSIWKSRA